MSRDLVEVIRDIARKEAAREVGHIGGPSIAPVAIDYQSIRTDLDRLSEEVKKLSQRVDSIESKIK